MKIAPFFLVFILLACNSQPKQEKLNIDISKGVRVKRGPDGKVIALPDSSRMDSL